MRAYEDTYGKWGFGPGFGLAAMLRELGPSEEMWTRVLVCVDDAEQVRGLLVHSLCRRHVEHLYVDPDRQGHGVGTMLLQHLVDEATDRHGACTLSLWTNPRNERALDFYARRGFSAAGVVYTHRVGITDLDITLLTRVVGAPAARPA